MTIPEGHFDVLTAQIASFRESLGSNSPQEDRRQFNELSLEFARLEKQLGLSATDKPLFNRSAKVQGIWREFRELKEAIATGKTFTKRRVQPFTITEVDKGLALTSAGALVLSYGLPTDYASVAWPVSLTALGLLGAKKVYDSCCARPAKVKVERDTAEPSSSRTRIVTRPTDTMRRQREDSHPAVPILRRSDEKDRRSSYDSKSSSLRFRPTPEPLMVPTGGGVRPYLITDHHAQIVKFRTWAKTRSWSSFHNGHFDWWAFPYDRSSSGRGDKYKLTPSEVLSLKQNPAFIKEYREGVQLLLASWGYDVNKGSNGQLVDNGGKYAGGTRDIRIWKILKSLKLFGERDLFDRVNTYAAMVGQPQCW